jgi:threonine/homoserine/homoserine lactone efflux protein
LNTQFFSMIIQLLLKGLLLGLLVSLPLGPLGILIVQRTANRDFRSGFYTAMGVATADTLWAILAGFSVAFLISFLREHQLIIQVIGSVVLFLLGLYIFRSHPIQALRKFKRKGSSPLQCYVSALVLTMSNPLIIVAYIAIFASANLVFDIHHLLPPLAFSFGFFLGAMSWWSIIITTINFLRHHFNLRILWWFNKVSGALIMTFILITTVVILIRGNPVF